MVSARSYGWIAQQGMANSEPTFFAARESVVGIVLVALLRVFTGMKKTKEQILDVNFYRKNDYTWRIIAAHLVTGSGHHHTLLHAYALSFA